MADLIRGIKSCHGFVRLISFTLCLCLLFSLAACDSAEEEPGTSDTLDVSNPPTEDVSDEAEDDPDEIAQPDETPDETGEESGEEDGASSAWEDVQAQVEALGLPEGPKFSGFEDFSFAGPYLESLGEFRQGSGRAALSYGRCLGILRSRRAARSASFHARACGNRRRGTTHSIFVSRRARNATRRAT